MAKGVLNYIIAPHESIILSMVSTCYTSFVIMLSNIAINGDIVGLHSPSCGQLVAHVLDDDSFMFKKPQKKISKGVCKL